MLIFIISSDHVVGFSNFFLKALLCKMRCLEGNVWYLTVCSTEKNKPQAPVIRGDPTKFNEHKTARYERISWRELYCPLYYIRHWFVWSPSKLTFPDILNFIQAVRQAEIHPTWCHESSWSVGPKRHKGSLQCSPSSGWLSCLEGFSTCVQVNFFLCHFISMRLKSKVFFSLHFFPLVPRTCRFNC